MFSNCWPISETFLRQSKKKESGYIRVRHYIRADIVTPGSHHHHYIESVSFFSVNHNKPMNIFCYNVTLFLKLVLIFNYAVLEYIPPLFLLTSLHSLNKPTYISAIRLSRNVKKCWIDSFIILGERESQRRGTLLHLSHYYYYFYH